MNGAIAELCARTINAPSMNSTTIMGTSHQRLLFTKNENSSPATPRFRVVVFRNFIIASPRKALSPFVGAMEKRAFGLLPMAEKGQLLHPEITEFDSSSNILQGGTAGWTARFVSLQSSKYTVADSVTKRQ